MVEDEGKAGEMSARCSIFGSNGIATGMGTVEEERDVSSTNGEEGRGNPMDSQNRGHLGSTKAEEEAVVEDNHGGGGE